ncbi:MAG: HEAT repeat domain-containing protein, partial [Phycisphaerales bacterium]
TDVDFGWDGRMYVSDWAGDGWFSDHTGELYAGWDPARVEEVDVRTAGTLAREGVASQTDDMLHQCLAHPDIRIRQRAHLELAVRGAETTQMLSSLAADVGAKANVRLHALWALGVQARRAAARTRNAAAETAIIGLLADGDIELRRLAARLAGDARIAGAAEALVSQLTDDDLRVRAQAAIALGKLKHADAIPNLAAMAWENDNQDPFVRHAAVMGLTGMDQPDKVRELAADQFPQTRLVAVLAMRRARDPQLARLLHDPDLRVATEAARAINDLPIPEAMPALAELAARFAPDERALEAASKSAAAATWERSLWKDRKGFNAARLASDPVWQTPADRTESVDEASGFTKAGNDYV